MNATHTERLNSIFAHSSTPALIASLRTLDALAQSTPSPDVNLSRAWTIEELERRFPAASAAVERAYLDDEERMAQGGEPVELDQVAILLAAIEQ